MPSSSSSLPLTPVRVQATDKPAPHIPVLSFLAQSHLRHANIFHFSSHASSPCLPWPTPASRALRIPYKVCTFHEPIRRHLADDGDFLLSSFLSAFTGWLHLIFLGRSSTPSQDLNVVSYVCLRFCNKGYFTVRAVNPQPTPNLEGLVWVGPSTFVSCPAA